MGLLVDRVKAAVTTGGTGNIVIGAAIAGFRGFSVVPDGAVISYVIEDYSGTVPAWEFGQGAWSSATNTLNRQSVTASSAGGTTKINVSTSAVCFIDAQAQDILDKDELGTGVLTALKIAVGTAGAFLTNGGALGTPISANLANATGLPISGIAGLGTGVGGALAIAPGTTGGFILVGGDLGTPSSINLANGTGLPLNGGVTGILPVANGGTGVGVLGAGVIAAAGNAANTASGLVVLDAAGKLPAIDGSQLTNLPAAGLAAVPAPKAAVLGGVFLPTRPANQFATGVDATGAFTYAQPAFTDISGTVAGSQLPNPSSGALGGVKSSAAVTNQFVTGIGVDGAVTRAQPSVGNLSGLGANVATALAAGTNTAGGVHTIGGALGTPASATLTNATGLPIAGIAGLGANIGSAMAIAANAASGLVTLGADGKLPALDGSNLTGIGYTLPVATTTTLGGVKANTGTGYVSGIAADGALQYTALPADYTLPAATETALGGVKVGHNPGTKFVNGVASDGTLLYASVPDYVLPAASAGALGGVKANVGTAGQFVSGIGADGSLTYGSPTAYSLPAASAAALGGVFANAGTAGQFVTGINATGQLTYGSPAAASIPAPTDTTLGGVFRQPTKPANSWVNGISATGALEYSALPAPTTTTLGGVKTVATPPTGQFINGFAADGTAQYAAVTGFALLDATQSWTKAQRGTPVVTTGAMDFALSNNWTLALTGAMTLAAPTNLVAGQSGVIVITQAATPGTLAFNAVWKWEGGTAPTVTATANAVDVLAYYVESATRITAKLIKGSA